MSLKSLNVYDIWFPKRVNNVASEIIIVAAEEPCDNKSLEASPLSWGYDYLKNVGDMTTLLDTSVFLSKNYPKANISRKLSREFVYRDGEDLKKNLVIIGGPKRNYACEFIMNRIKSKISYSLDPDVKMIYNAQDYHWGWVEEGGTEFCYGYFAAFTNPWNNKNRIILVHGLTSFGGVGSFKALSEPSNYFALSKVDDKIDFEMAFKVDVQGCVTGDFTRVNIEVLDFLKDRIFINYLGSSIETDDKFIPSQSQSQVIQDCNVPLLLDEIAQDKAKMDKISVSNIYEHYNDDAKKFSAILLRWHTKLFGAAQEVCREIQREYTKLKKSTQYIKIIGLKEN